MSTLTLTKVVVMEDRAQLERRGTLALTGGVQTFEFPGLPLVTVDRSLSVELTGATLHEARLVRRWKEKARGGLPVDASELRRRVQVLVEQQYGHDSDVYRLTARKEALAETRAQLLTSIAQRTGAGESELSQWQGQLDALGTAQRELDVALQDATRASERAKKELSSSRQALAIAEERAEDLECVLVLTVEGSGSAPVRVSSLVPCAVWRPAYRATLATESVLVETEAVVWQRTGEAWTDVALAFSTARPTLGTTPPTLTDDWLSLRPKTTVERRQVEVAVREETIQSAGEQSAAAPEFPGLDDGGEARLIEAPGRASIPSDGQPHRVPLGTFQSKPTLELTCPAELSPLAFTVARFTNESGRVLLAGPVDLIRSAGFVGRTQLAFTAPGETLKLSFGSEDGVRVTRRLDEKTDEARLTGRRTTKKTVTLFVSNAGREPKRLSLQERILVSEVKEVEAQVLTKECDPTPGPVSRDGVATIDVQLGSNATRKVTFVWEVSAAAKVAGL